MSAQSIYNIKGYADRLAYLSDLADTYNVDLNTVMCAAELLGADEDFDGLVSTLADISMG